MQRAHYDIIYLFIQLCKINKNNYTPSICGELAMISFIYLFSFVKLTRTTTFLPHAESYYDIIYLFIQLCKINKNNYTPSICRELTMISFIYLFSFVKLTRTTYTPSICRELTMISFIYLFSLVKLTRTTTLLPYAESSL